MSDNRKLANFTICDGYAADLFKACSDLQGDAVFCAAYTPRARCLIPCHQNEATFQSSMTPPVCAQKLLSLWFCVAVPGFGPLSDLFPTKESYFQVYVEGLNRIPIYNNGFNITVIISTVSATGQLSFREPSTPPA